MDVSANGSRDTVTFSTGAVTYDAIVVIVTILVILVNDVVVVLIVIG